MPPRCLERAWAGRLQPAWTSSPRAASPLCPGGPAPWRFIWRLRVQGCACMPRPPASMGAVDPVQASTCCKGLDAAHSWASLCDQPQQTTPVMGCVAHRKPASTTPAGARPVPEVASRRSAAAAGYQPFLTGSPTGVSLYVKQTASGSSSIGAASGAPVPPSVQLSLGNAEQARACGCPCPALRCSARTRPRAGPLRCSCPLATHVSCWLPLGAVEPCFPSRLPPSAAAATPAAACQAAAHAAGLGQACVPQPARTQAAAPFRPDASQQR